MVRLWPSFFFFKVAPKGGVNKKTTRGRGEASEWGEREQGSSISWLVLKEGSSSISEFILVVVRCM